jgi:hypothetical protein
MCFDHPSEDSYGTYSSSKSSAKNSKDVSNIIDVLYDLGSKY